MLAAATAAEINGYFISIDAASIMSKWLGEAEKNVSKLFTEARKLLEKGDPVIIFIDELDSLLGCRTNEVGGEIRVQEPVPEGDGRHPGQGEHIHLYTIGATNKPWALDWPFLRRFEKRIYVPLPNFEGRMSMFKNYTAPINVDPGISLEDLSRISEGYSGSDISDICQGGQLRVVRELFETGKALDKSVQPRPIVMTDFKEIMKSRQAQRLARDAARLRQLGRAVQGPLSILNAAKAPRRAGGALEETTPARSPPRRLWSARRSRVCGWVHDVRLLGGINFVLLRNSDGIIQVTAPKKAVPKEVMDQVTALHPEDVIRCTGLVKEAKSREERVRDNTRHDRRWSAPRPRRSPSTRGASPTPTSTRG